MIRFSFNEKKATAAAGRFLQWHGGHIGIMRLIKLLYLSERESLRVYGRPIFGDQYFSLPHGPIVSRVYDLTKSNLRIGSGVWKSHFRRKHFILSATAGGAEPDYSVLSPAEDGVLASVHNRHRDRDVFEIVAYTHHLPEWKDPGRSSRPIEVEDLLEGMGKSPAEIEAIEEHAGVGWEIDQVFASLGYPTS